MVIYIHSVTFGILSSPSLDFQEPFILMACYFSKQLLQNHIASNPWDKAVRNRFSGGASKDSTIKSLQLYPVSKTFMCFPPFIWGHTAKGSNPFPWITFIPSSFTKGNRHCLINSADTEASELIPAQESGPTWTVSFYSLNWFFIM